MKRVLLFLVLAGGGLAALAWGTGGFLGSGIDAPKPEVPVVHDSVADSDAPSEVRVSELPPFASGPGKSFPDFAPKRLKSVDYPVVSEVVWTDPITKEKLVLPFFVEQSLHIDDLEMYRDPSGVAGERWRGVHITMYRDPKRLSRSEAEMLLADPKSRKALVHCEISAAEGNANFRLVPFADNSRKRPSHTMIHLTKDVVIHLLREDLTIATTDVTIDKEAQTAEGSDDITAENGQFVLKGKGFRLDKLSGRLDVLQDIELDVREMAAAGGRDPQFGLGSGPFQPRKVRARGPAMVVSREEGAVEVFLEDRVHVEGEGGSRLDADSLRLFASAPQGRGHPKEVADLEKSAKYRLTKMVASGNVDVESREMLVNGKPASELSIATDRMTSLFGTDRLDRALLEGRTTIRYAGNLTLDAGHGSASTGTVVATCRESLTYGPRVASPEVPPCDAVLDLVGSARVEGAPGGPREESQRIEADHIRLFLRKRAEATTVAALPQSAPQASQGSPLGGQKMEAVGFLATGGDVRLAGPWLTGTAHEMKGFDLDTPTWRVVATGPDTRFEVSEDTTMSREGSKAGSGSHGESKESKKKPEWKLDRLTATRGVRGSMRPTPEGAPISFTGETLTFSATDGGELRAAEGQRATLSQPGAAGRDDVVESPLIGFQLTEGKRRLWTRAGTHAVIWQGPSAATSHGSPAAKERRTIAVQSASAIEFYGGLTATRERTLTVEAHDGAAVETRVDAMASDRVAAAEIRATLVERDTPVKAPSAPAGATSPPSEPKPSLSTTTEVPTRWTVDCETIDLDLGGVGGALGQMRSLTAKGHVDARSDTPTAPGASQRFEGEQLAFDGVTGKGFLAGTEAARAHVTFGEEALAQRLASPRVDFSVVGGALNRATFAPPVAGLFHAAQKGKPEVERYALRSDGGPLVVDAAGAVVTGTADRPVIVVRSIRSAEGKPFERPMTLTTPRLDMKTASGLGKGPTIVERFTADGPNTKVETGTPGKDFSTAIGDHIEYERRTSMLRLTGRQRVDLLRPGGRGRVNWVTVDLLTGAVDFEGADLVLDLGK